MGFINRILNKIISYQKSDDIVKLKINDETDYYKWFFTENSDWNTILPNYDEQIRWEGIQQFLLKLNLSNEKNVEILDIGCGRGWLSFLLTKYGTVTGIEPISPVVEFGKKIYPGLNLVSGESSDLINKGEFNKYDLIVSSEVIEHVPEIRKNEFVKNIWALLKLNGFVIITTPRKEVVNEYSNFMKPSQPIEDWLSENDIEKLFISNKFEKIAQSRLEKKYDDFNQPLEIYQIWAFKKVN